jgi:uncharacterized phage protein (TIGR01671 family)
MTPSQLTVKRVIKFRAWARQGDWEPDDNRMSFTMIDAEALAFEKYAPLVDCLSDVEDEIYFMQLIGILDKHGKEVYEGDRIRIYWRDDDFTDEVITYDEKYCYFKYGNNPICELFDPETPFEVISNIYENPELISQP